MLEGMPSARLHLSEQHGLAYYTLAKQGLMKSHAVGGALLLNHGHVTMQQDHFDAASRPH